MNVRILALGTLSLLVGLAQPAWAARSESASVTGAAARAPVCHAQRPGVAHCMAIQLLDPVTNWHGAHVPGAARHGRPNDKLTLGEVSATATEPAPSGYFPAELQSAYGLASVSASSGSTQTVAVVDAYDDPNAETDLATYRARSKLPACTTANGCFAKVNQQGGSSYPSANTGWSEEISVDLDMVSAICSNCHILLVEANSDALTDLGAAEDYAAVHANVVSNSYAAAQFLGETEYNPYYDHSGVAITASAGDSGYGVEYPASSPFVTAVGGTTLQPATATTRGWSETVWGESGSGCSLYESRPEWQPLTPECAKRTVADVAADANPNTGVAVYDNFHESGWLAFGGTSVSSPIVASIYALSGNASSFTVNSTGSDAAQDLYADSPVLNKVSSGTNAADCSVYLCNAADSLFTDEGHEYDGYNGPTGNGTPDGVSTFQLARPSTGDWVGAYGSAGYDLAGWDGSTGDVSYLPNASLSLVQGSRWQWAANTSDPRALNGPDEHTRNAGAYYDPNEIEVKLSFTAAYSGNLRLYAVDWDSTARRELITVDGQSADLSSNFNQGAWTTFPISVAAGGSVTITVTREAGANAVLSGIFLGDAGAPPGPTVASAPRGSWVGTYGSAGYDLAGWDGSTGDVSYLPNASLSLVQGSRWQWAANTSDARALSDPAALTRNAGTFYDPNEIQLKLSFAAAYSGNLHLYAMDWDHIARREVITVNDQSAVLGEFNEGAWVTFPINVSAGGVVTITVDRTSGANAVLSGIFLGDAGAPPAMPVSSVPQGNWAGAYGSSGYDLLGFDGSSDLTSLSNASPTVEQGSRYQWASSTTDARALESPTGSTRVAATLYDSNQIRLYLSFTTAYSGNLELYAVDWDSTERREMISVNGQTAMLASDFNAGAWITFPVSVAAGGTVTITVDRLAGSNAVLSGVFLG